MKRTDVPMQDGPTRITDGLVGEEQCRKIIWPDEKARPSSRWFVELKARGLIPFHRIGRRVFYDPKEVRRALDRQFKVNPKY